MEVTNKEAQEAYDTLHKFCKERRKKCENVDGKYCLFCHNGYHGTICDLSNINGCQITRGELLFFAYFASLAILPAVIIEFIKR